MPNICFCNSAIPWGGGEKWHLEAACAFAARGFKVFFICHPKSEIFKRLQNFSSIEIFTPAISRLSFLNPFLHRSLKSFFIQNNIQSVILNMPSDLKSVGSAAASAGLKNVIYRRGSALPVRNTFFNRLLFRKVITRLIVNSQATKRFVLVNNPALISEDLITVLPNGINVSAFDAALTKPALSALSASQIAVFSNPVSQTGTAERPFIIGNAGRLTMQKGQHLLLYLAAVLQKKGFNFRIIIAGTGERQKELEALAKTLGVEKLIDFVGFMEDLSLFWQNIDLFFLSSLWEGFGNVLIEAMLAEKPIFAFAVSNIPELISDGENGRLFSLPAEELADCPDFGAGRQKQGTGDYYASLQEPADALLALASNPGQGRLLGKAGRERALVFDQERCMDKLEELLIQN